MDSWHGPWWSPEYWFQCLLLALDEFGIKEEDALGVQRAPQGAERVARRRRRGDEEEEEEDGDEGGDEDGTLTQIEEEEEGGDEDEGVGDLDEVGQAVE